MQIISTYFSFAYIELLLLAVICYSIFPQKARRWVLLLFSYLFFYTVSGSLIIYLLVATLLTYLSGIWLDKVKNDGKQELKAADKEHKKLLKEKTRKKQIRIIVLAAVLLIGILAVLKYSPFAVTNINTLFRLLHLPYEMQIPEVLVPIGISFYTLQALAYLFDVYRQKMPADRNLLRIALFMSFFPQIMEGPICRYSDTTESLWQADGIKWDRFIKGSQRIAFGIMKKLLVADRLNRMLKYVFFNFDTLDGSVIALGAASYTLQLYMDFSGTMDVVIGSAEIFGVKLPENFRRPFFSRTISEFWQRWHITLGTWFRDYIFYPVSMAKSVTKLTLRVGKRLGRHAGSIIAGGIALFCVWICNGIWHGAGWQFIFFGMYHFVLIFCGNIIQPVVIKTAQELKIDRESLGYRIVQTVRTGILVCIGEMFFRAHGLRDGLGMFRRLVTDFHPSALRSGIPGMDQRDWMVIGAFVIFLFIIGIIQERGVIIREEINSKSLWLRLTIYCVFIMIIIVFGAYGLGYTPVDPIYANF